MRQFTRACTSSIWWLKFWKNTPKATRPTSLRGHPEATKGDRCFISFNFVIPMKKREERKKAKCPKCQAEYDVLDDAPVKAMGGLCAACWHEVHIENKKLTVEGQKVVDKS